MGALDVRLVDISGALLPVEAGAVARLRRGEEIRDLVPTAGGFSGSELVEGVWILEISLPGFPDISSEVEIIEGERSTADVVMDLGLEEIVVVDRTDAERLERSAAAVTVIETEEARTQSADLGEVMARSQGVGVRRSGGLGSGARLSLGGLTDDQIRLFLDGLPLDLAGYPLGISSVPVDLIERIEVYRGVVPVRFGADALGGAVELVSERREPGFDGSASYQGGSFDTHRLAANLGAKARFGGFVRAVGYVDRSANDYTVDVEVPDEVGRLSPATVRRFHDAYASEGGSLEIGVSERPWAERLSLRLFGSRVDQELQNNIVMSVPYGEARYGVTTAGMAASFRYERPSRLTIDANAGYTATTTELQDLSTCVYDWFGRCIRERSTPGEIRSPGSDQVVWDDAVVGRLVSSYRLSEQHALTLAIAPTTFGRTGEDRLLSGDLRDPLGSQRDAMQVVTGLEHQLDAGPLQNLLFVKQYHQAVRSEEPLAGGGLDDVSRSTWRFGLGDGARIALGSELWAKASYEWAARLPTPEEIFGDAVLVLDNLDLAPESSHNANLGLTLGALPTPAGQLRADVNLFLRQSRDLIVLLGNDRTFTYFNVYGARSLGVEAASGWTSPGEWLSIDGNTSWIELRNTSEEGAFGDFEGDRIPNRPWLLFNATISLGASSVAAEGDRLTLDLYSRYVHEFFRGWESVGLVEYKQVVPSQLSHTAAATYVVSASSRKVSASVEIQNLTDADLYDFFGIQRPGRAAFGKLSVSW